jgi:hypothetical protein
MLFLEVLESGKVASLLKGSGVNHHKMLGMLIEQFKIDYPSVLFIDVGEFKKVGRILERGGGFKIYKPDAILGNEEGEEIWLEAEEDRFDILKKITKIGYWSMRPKFLDLPKKVVFLAVLARERVFLDICKKLWAFFGIKSELEIFDFEFSDYHEDESGFSGTINKEKIERVSRSIISSRGTTENTKNII